LIVMIWLYFIVVDAIRITKILQNTKDTWKILIMTNHQIIVRIPWLEKKRNVISLQLTLSDNIIYRHMNIYLIYIDYMIIHYSNYILSRWNHDEITRSQRDHEITSWSCGDPQHTKSLDTGVTSRSRLYHEINSIIGFMVFWNSWSSNQQY